MGGIIEDIRELRIRNQITQQELSDLSGVPFATINRLENGKANPTLKTLYKLLSVFGYEIRIVRSQTVQHEV